LEIIKRQFRIFFMINEETVFILGAGASCHLGYPLGNYLWKRIVDYLSSIKDFGKISKEESIKEKERKKNRDLMIEVGLEKKFFRKNN